MPRPIRAPHIRRLTMLAIGVSMAVTATACSAGSGESADQGGTAASLSPTANSVITKAAADKIVDRYQVVNNRSNQEQNEKLLATVEAGTLNEQSAADYEQWPTFSKKYQQRYEKPWLYTHRSYYIPPASSGATWFAVKADNTGDAKYEALLIFDKVGGTYKNVFAVDVKKGVIPQIAVDRDGFATVADSAMRVGTLAPRQLGDALSDVLETGGQKEAKLALTDATQAYAKRYQERDSSSDGKDVSWRTLKYLTKTPTHPTAYALRLAGGGTIAVFPFAFNGEYLHKRYMSGGTIIPGKQEAVYDSTERPLVIDVYQGQALAALHPTGKPSVLGAEERMVDSK